MVPLLVRRIRLQNYAKEETGSKQIGVLSLVPTEAWTIDGYKAMDQIRKGQIRRLAKGEVVGQCRFVHMLFGIAA